MAVIGLTLFPLAFPLPGEPRLPLDTLVSRINLIPFYFGKSVRLAFSLKGEQFANILLTIPYGFLLPFFKQITFPKFLIYAFGIGLGIELTQLCLIIITGGGFYRVADINDVLFNATGALLGYAIRALLSTRR